MTTVSVYLFAKVTKLTAWSRALLDKLTVTQLDQKFPAFNGSRRFITVFTANRHWSLSWARCIQSTTFHPSSLTSSLILLSHLFLVLPSGFFPARFLIEYCVNFYPHIFINYNFHLSIALLNIREGGGFKLLIMCNGYTRIYKSEIKHAEQVRFEWVRVSECVCS